MNETELMRIAKDAIAVATDALAQRDEARRLLAEKCKQHEQVTAWWQSEIRDRRAREAKDAEVTK